MITYNIRFSQAVYQFTHFYAMETVQAPNLEQARAAAESMLATFPERDCVFIREISVAA